MKIRVLLHRCCDWCLLPYELGLRLWLERQVRSWVLPAHLGLILDGNRRYARELGLPSVLAGHARGAEKLREVLSWCFDLNIGTVTAWVFSLDNFHREPAEVAGLLELIEAKLRELLTSGELQRRGVRVHFLGRLETLPATLRAVMAEVTARTAGNRQFQLNVALAYSGREEILDAVQGALAAAPPGAPRVVDADTLARHLYTSGQPDPDLIIRTSGEVRLSGFLLWQSAYAEYFFSRRLWPDFRKADLLRALRSFHCRRRRFGR